MPVTAFRDQYDRLHFQRPRTDSTRKILAICHAYFKAWTSNQYYGVHSDDVKSIVAKDAVVNLGVTLDELAQGLRLGELNVQDYLGG